MRTRKELADILRNRQLERAPEIAEKLGFDVNTFQKTVSDLSDDEIILSYITCSQCGEALVSLEDVDTILEQNPETFDAFWDILQIFGSTHDWESCR